MRGQIHNRIILVLFMQLCVLCSKDTLASQLPLFHDITSFIPGEMESVYTSKIIRNVGDIDKDGVEDIVASSVHQPNIVANPGLIELFSGATGQLINSYRPTLLGELKRGTFGAEIAGVGDINGDGFNDIAVAANGMTNLEGVLFAGRVYVLSGQFFINMLSGPPILGVAYGKGYLPDLGETFGTSMSGVGDIDGDGKPDFLVGGPLYSTQGLPNQSAGRLALISGQVDSNGVFPQLAEFQGVSDPSNIERLGAKVISLSEIREYNQDIPIESTKRHVVVSAPQYSLNEDYWEGRVVLLHFQEVDDEIVFEQIEEHFGGRDRVKFGEKISFVGDLEGDQIQDFAVGWNNPDGTQSYNSEIEEIRIFRGDNGVSTFTLQGPHSSIDYGESIASASDVDQDGVRDLFISISGMGTNGVVALVSPVTNQILEEVVHSSSQISVMGRYSGSLRNYNEEGRCSHLYFADIGVLWFADDNVRILGRCGAIQETPLIASLVPGPSTRIEERAVGNIGYVNLNIGDWDGDGFEDFLSTSGNHFIRLYSGMTMSPMVNQFGQIKEWDMGGVVETMTLVGDLNGDHQEDVAIGIPSFNDNRGKVRIVSLTNGEILWEVHGPRARSEFGSALTSMGDLDQDPQGKEELAIAAKATLQGTQQTGTLRQGLVYLFSTNRPYRDFLEIHPPIGGSLYGGSLAANQAPSPFPRLFIGAPGVNYNTGNFNGFVDVIHSFQNTHLPLKDWSLSRTSLPGQIEDARFGHELALIQDGNDHHLGVSAPGDMYEPFTGNLKGYVQVWSFNSSNQSYSLLWHRDGQNDNDRYGHSLSTIEDLDQDGVQDLIISAYQRGNNLYNGSTPPQFFTGLGKVEVISTLKQNLILQGGSGAQPWAFEGKSHHENFGYDVISLRQNMNHGKDGKSRNPMILVSVPGYHGEDIPFDQGGFRTYNSSPQASLSFNMTSFDQSEIHDITIEGNIYIGRLKPEYAGYQFGVIGGTDYDPSQPHLNSCSYRGEIFPFSCQDLYFQATTEQTNPILGVQRMRGDVGCGTFKFSFQATGQFSAPFTQSSGPVRDSVTYWHQVVVIDPTNGSIVYKSPQMVPITIFNNLQSF